MADHWDILLTSLAPVGVQKGEGELKLMSYKRLADLVKVQGEEREAQINFVL